MVAIDKLSVCGDRYFGELLIASRSTGSGQVDGQLSRSPLRDQQQCVRLP